MLRLDRQRFAGLALVVLPFVTAAISGCPVDDPAPLRVEDAGDADGCVDECSPEGKRTCGGERQVLRCERVDGCLTFVEDLECPENRRCEGGTCVGKSRECSDECTPDGEPRCDGEGRLVRCDDHDEEACFEWGDPRPCGEGEVCDDKRGECVEYTCEPECSVGETACEEDLIKTCENNRYDCPVFSAAEPCPEGEVCRDGSCVASDECEDECDGPICRSDSARSACEDLDGDGCREIAEVTACDSSQKCKGGECVDESTCTDECPAGETVCVGNKIAECADHDNDDCVEYEEPRECPGGGTCKGSGSDAECGMPQNSGTVVVNEVLYDPIDDDTRSKGSGSGMWSPTFVELAGPSGLAIGGYEIVLTNGANGNEYGRFALPSDAQLDGGGYAVVVMNNPGTYLTQTAPTLSNVYELMDPYQQGVDAIQNGPDNLVLEDGAGTTVDAVGWGYFGSSSTFDGEGTAAVSASPGQSIGRRDEQDTDDNLSDFHTFYPTPGLENSDLVVNEVYFNQPGLDDKTRTFIEIAAPITGWEDYSLTGYNVEAINGYDGKPYLPKNGSDIGLFGERLNGGNTGDGYFVICNDVAERPPNGPPCDKRYTGGDLQNGPDNVVLNDVAREVDAVGYGSFGSSSHFEGEGSPISFSRSDAGKSINRWPRPAFLFDLDNNLVDFHKAQPTLGKPNKRP